MTGARPAKPICTQIYFFYKKKRIQIPSSLLRLRGWLVTCWPVLIDPRVCLYLCVFLQRKPTGKSPSSRRLGENFSLQFGVNLLARRDLTDAQSILVGKTGRIGKRR